LLKKKTTGNKNVDICFSAQNIIRYAQNWKIGKPLNNYHWHV